MLLMAILLESNFKFELKPIKWNELIEFAVSAIMQRTSDYSVLYAVTVLNRLFDRM